MKLWTTVKRWWHEETVTVRAGHRWQDGRWRQVLQLFCFCGYPPITAVLQGGNHGEWQADEQEDEKAAAELPVQEQECDAGPYEGP
ncbi:MAG: hypothetical protein ACYDER_09590 [Ktedonobacteraceae bacterium]